MLWGKKCRSYKGSNLGGFGAITPERLAYSVYILAFHKVNFVLSSLADAKRT